MQGNDRGRNEGNDQLINSRHLRAGLGSWALPAVPAQAHPQPPASLTSAAAADGTGHHLMRAPSNLLLALTFLNH